MSRARTITVCAAAAIAAAALAVPQGRADEDGAQSQVPFQVAGGDCYAVGQQVAQQSGGTLAKASESSQNGQPVCVVVVLVPGKEGQRPRRTEVVVPLR